MIVMYRATVPDEWTEYKVRTALEEAKIGYSIHQNAVVIERQGATVENVSLILETMEKFHLPEKGFAMIPESENDTLKTTSF